jgi:hypothetical protein
VCKLPAQVRLVADVADTKVAGIKVLAAEPNLDAGRSVAHRVLELQQIQTRVDGANRVSLPGRLCAARQLVDGVPGQR